MHSDCRDGYPGTLIQALEIHNLRLASTKKRIHLALAFFFLSPAASGEEPPLGDAQIIDNSYDEWVQVLNRKDIDLWSSYLAPNAVFAPPDNPPLETNKDIIDYYLALFRNPLFIKLECSQEFIDVADSRDIAWSRGTCNAFFTTDSGTVGNRTSKWTKIWVRLEDGSWKCRLNIWNYNESD
jgi:ketosteroid isomerase-like protein